MRIRKPSGQRKTTCSKCNKPLEPSRINQRYCKACHAESMRNNRPKHRDLHDEQRKKANCRAYLNVYIRRGKVIKQPCIICGKEAEAHHEDYSNPLEVVWLCREHHLSYHKQQAIDPNRAA